MESKSSVLSVRSNAALIQLLSDIEKIRPSQSRGDIINEALTYVSERAKDGNPVDWPALAAKQIYCAIPKSEWPATIQAKLSEPTLLVEARNQIKTSFEPPLSVIKNSFTIKLLLIAYCDFLKMNSEISESSSEETALSLVRDVAELFLTERNSPEANSIRTLITAWRERRES